MSCSISWVGTISLLVYERFFLRGTAYTVPLSYWRNTSGGFPIGLYLLLYLSTPVLFFGPPPDLPSGAASFTLYLYNSSRSGFCQYFFWYYLNLFAIIIIISWIFCQYSFWIISICLKKVYVFRHWTDIFRRDTEPQRRHACAWSPSQRY